MKKFTNHVFTLLLLWKMTLSACASIYIWIQLQPIIFTISSHECRSTLRNILFYWLNRWTFCIKRFSYKKKNKNRRFIIIFIVHEMKTTFKRNHSQTSNAYYYGTTAVDKSYRKNQPPQDCVTRGARLENSPCAHENQTRIRRSFKCRNFIKSTSIRGRVNRRQVVVCTRRLNRNGVWRTRGKRER